MVKLLVASEYAEPSFFVDKVIASLESEASLLSANGLGLLLITKNVKGSEPIYSCAKTLKIPTVVHATITTLGGSKLEPKVPPWQESVRFLRGFIKRVDNPSAMVLRVDPLVPRVTDFFEVRKLVEEASKLGITRCRTSVVDYYPFVRQKLTEAGIPVVGDGFNPPPSEMEYCLGMILKICEQNDMVLESCAERCNFLYGLRYVGCASHQEWLKMGLTMEDVKHKQRRNCFCDVEKHDLLSHWKECGYGCLYCYWGKNRTQEI